MLTQILDRRAGGPVRGRCSTALSGSWELVACLLLCACLPGVSAAQAISKQQLIFYTAEWKGERFPDGRPKVSDDVLKRMEKVSIEEAWAVLRSAGYHNQFEGGWKMIHRNRTIVGRALTAVYMPARPELQRRMLQKGHKEGRIGPMNSWPIDMLQKGDVYVADAFGKIVDGTLIGDNLGNSIYAKSGNGVVFDGALRDLEGLEEIEGFNAFVRGWDPSAIREMMLMGLNVPTRIGRATVLPGDVVLAKREGVIFIPAHLAQRVVERAEVVMLRDQFGHQRLREGKYTPGQIDSAWSEEIEKDFTQWLKAHVDELPVPKEAVQKLLKTRGGSSPR
ncbi:MAG: RraA family protein [Planctomycetota bacterium]|jgi:regulator of RNase E activity RraA